MAPSDLLDAAHRDGRLDERDACALRRARGLHLRTLREHPAESDRREDHRQRQSLAEQLHGRIASRHVAHHDLAQQQPLEIADVGAQRGLLVGAAVDVVEQLAGQPAPRQLAVVEHGRRCDSQGPVSSEAHGRNPIGSGFARAPGQRRSCAAVAASACACASASARSASSSAAAALSRRACAESTRALRPLELAARLLLRSLARPSGPGRVRARGPRPRPFAPESCLPLGSRRLAPRGGRGPVGAGTVSPRNPSPT